MKNFIEKSRPAPQGKNRRIAYQYMSKPEGKGIVFIDVYHRDGGYNFSSHEPKPKGIVVNMAIKDVEGGFIRYAPMDDCNQILHVKDQLRFNGHMVAKVAELFDQHAPEIASLWEDEATRPQAIELLLRIKDKCHAL